MNKSNSLPESFTQLVVNKIKDDVQLRLQKLSVENLDSGDVTIRVSYSSLNYKDALCATAHPGVARNLPLVPGIDAAGVVVDSASDQFQAGDNVMIFHEEFGTSMNGAYSEYIRVPAEWVYTIPEGMMARDAMIYGTAGFTAAQCVEELQKHNIQPEQGEIIVTGATGGVGIFAVKLLAKLGYKVVASTGKADRAQWLMQNGAHEVLARENVNDSSDRPLLKSRWAGAIDTVGGNTLATVIRSTRRFGCVTACGVVGGADMPLTVYPFILRGVTLQGIDTAGISRERRAAIWGRMANDWAVDGLAELAEEVPLDGIPAQVGRILKGEVAGRVIVNIGAETNQA